MQASGNPTIDAERFAIMLDTGKQLSEGLDTHLLDDRRQPVCDKSIQRYYQLLNLDEVETNAETIWNLGSVLAKILPTPI